jgi:hypothetical protein
MNAGSVPERASTAYGSHETGSSKKSLGPASIVGYRNCLVTIQRKAEFPVPPINDGADLAARGFHPPEMKRAIREAFVGASG